MSKKVTLPVWTVAPPMTSLGDALRTRGIDPQRVRVGMIGDPRQNFETFARATSNLDVRQIGNADDLAFAYGNAHAAEHVARELAALMKQHQLPDDERASHAGVGLVVAAAMIQSATLTYMREAWHHHATLILCRSALETAARAGIIAIGSGGESDQWVRGPQLQTDAERRAAQISAAQCCRHIEATVQARWAGATPPIRVYHWLCQYTHLDFVAIRKLVPAADSYAAIAYISWLTAVLSERVCGVQFAQVPQRWPSPLPR